jgi:LAO/AO transport system kinase
VAQRTPPRREADPLDAGTRALLDGAHRLEKHPIARLISLVEREGDAARARKAGVFRHLAAASAPGRVIGITGTPGAGKSSLIGRLALELVHRDGAMRVSVVAIDPTSIASGGALLGDRVRTRFPVGERRIFFRSQATQGDLGGVGRRTWAVTRLLRHFFDLVFVETVGVGQSETAVAGMTDLFVLLQLPNAGDDLQAIKRGVMELADLVAINKADLDDAAATRAMAQITSALRIFGFHGRAEHHAAPVLKLSALKGEGVAAFWSAVRSEAQTRRNDGRFDARRRAQREAWLWDVVRARLLDDFRHHAAVREALPPALAAVNDSRTAPTVAARRLLDLFEKN